MVDELEEFHKFLDLTPTIILKFKTGDFLIDKRNKTLVKVLRQNSYSYVLMRCFDKRIIRSFSFFVNKNFTKVTNLRSVKLLYGD
jgi:hypothetical protein